MKLNLNPDPYKPKGPALRFLIRVRCAWLADIVDRRVDARRFFQRQSDVGRAVADRKLTTASLPTENHLMTMTGGVVSSDVVGGQVGSIQPVLQLADGSFVGIGSDPTYGSTMVAYDTSGNVKWTAPGYNPDIATADGGIIADVGGSYNGIQYVPGPGSMFDASSGLATGQLSSFPTQSWVGNDYQLGSVEGTLSIPVAPVTPPYWSFSEANQSSNKTSPLCHDDGDQLIAEYGTAQVLDSFFKALGYPSTKWPRFTPNCFELARSGVTSAHSANFTFAQFNTPAPSASPEFSDRALIKYPLVAPASAGYGLDKWVELYGSSRIINSGYRDPAQNGPHGGVLSSRHMFGDAVDLRNQTCPSSQVACAPAGIAEWQSMVDAAGDIELGTGALADFVEKADGPCGYNCTHADWRYHDRGKWVH
jgi:Peptidase M15